MTTITEKLAEALAYGVSRHTYETDGRGRLVVRAPESTGGALVCTLAGDPGASSTHRQAEAICEALDAAGAL